MAFNHYHLLGVPPDADFKRIKAAYRSMAKRFHPDRNKGSEAASDLFRQINEAYRVLSDEQLRKRYDQQLAATRTDNPQPAAPHKTEAPDPQQKFNRFLNSLLDAIFETPEPATGKTEYRQKVSRKKPVKRKNPAKPDFNFYYYLAMEKNSPSYHCDEDGVYRRADSGRPSRFRGGPCRNLALLLLAGLWQFFQP